MYIHILFILLLRDTHAYANKINKLCLAAGEGDCWWWPGRSVVIDNCLAQWPGLGPGLGHVCGSEIPGRNVSCLDIPSVFCPSTTTTNIPLAQLSVSLPPPCHRNAPGLRSIWLITTLPITRIFCVCVFALEDMHTRTSVSEPWQYVRQPSSPALWSITMTILAANS